MIAISRLAFRKRKGAGTAKSKVRAFGTHGFYGIFAATELAMLLLLAAMLFLPLFFGIWPQAVATQSMEPSVPKGSLAWVDTKIQKTTLQEGDIAMYRVEGDKRVLHRIERIEPSGHVRMKGDMNSSSDSSLVSLGDIDGRMVFSIPFWGFAYMTLDSNRIMMLAILVLANVALFMLDKRFMIASIEDIGASKRGHSGSGARGIPDIPPAKSLSQHQIRNPSQGEVQHSQLDIPLIRSPIPIEPASSVGEFGSSHAIRSAACADPRYSAILRSPSPIALSNPHGRTFAVWRGANQNHAYSIASRNRSQQFARQSPK